MKRNVVCQPISRLHVGSCLFVKTFITILLIVISLTTSFATDYYFSSSSGDDNRSVAQAQNPSTPWKTIDKLNSIASSLKAGDRILFKSGDTFFGTINVVRGGNPGNPIVYTSYGTGEKPIITSMTRITNWVSRGNGVYQADFTPQDGNMVQILTINDQLKEFGRYPNVGSNNDGYLTITSVNNALSIQGANLPANFVGGEIVIRKNNWVIDRHQVTYNGGGTVNFTNNPITIYPALKDFGYFIQNHVNTLDQPGEWAYSQSDKKLYVHFGSQNPTNLRVEVAARHNLVKVNKYIKNLSFNNLNLKGANSDLIRIENSGNIQVTNSKLSFSGENAIFAAASPELIIRNNFIDYSLSGGLFFHFGTPNTLIEDNVIDHTMPFQGMAGSSDLKGEAIYIAADANNSQITRNRVYNTGFNGIHFGGNYTLVKNNLVDNYCLYKQDGGGIYTNSDGLTTMNNIGRQIIGNIVLRGVGSAGGSNVNFKLAEGIYIDDSAMGITIQDNTVADISSKGIYLHNNSNIEILNNLFYNIPIQLHMNHDPLGGAMRNIRVEGNQFSSIIDDELAFSIASIQNDIHQVGVSNNNYYLDPFGVDLLFKSKGPNDGPLGQKRSLSNWRSNFGYDKNSLKPAFNLQNYVVKSSSIIKESDFNSNLSMVAGTYNANSELSTGISSGTWKVSPSPYSIGSAFIQIGAVAAGDEILIEFDTKSMSPDQTVEVLLEKTFNQNQEGTIFSFVTSGDVKRVKLLLKSNITSGSESIVFRFPKTIQNILFDNMKVSKVVTERIDPKQQMFFQYNYSNNAVSHPLPGTFKNAKGEVFKGSVTIPPYRSVLLVKTDDGSPQGNLPPTISIAQPVNNQVYKKGDAITVKTNAADPENQIQKVEIYANGNLLNTLTKAPYEFTINNAQVGTYQLHAKVYDQGNLTAESAKVAIKVEDEDRNSPPQNLPPSIGLVQPSQNQTFQKEQGIHIKAAPSDPENKVAKVELYYNSILLATLTNAPYEFIIPQAPLGNYTLHAKVYDDAGQTAESSKINIAVVASIESNKAPSVQVVTPKQNHQYVHGEKLLIEANASDPDGYVAKVEFYSGANLLGSSTTAPYKFEVNNVPVGNYVLKAKAIDNKGLATLSSGVNVSVISATVPNQAPTVSIVTPTQNHKYTAGQQVVIEANASDPEGKVAKVEFFAGESLIGTATTSPYKMVVNGAPVGTYSLKAKVTDDKGLTAMSSAVNFAVVSEALPNQAPSIQIITPSPNQTYNPGQTVVIETIATDPEGKVAKVEFFAEGMLVGQVTAPPYRMEVKDVPLGNYVLKARVTDDKGLTAQSSNVNVSVVSTQTSTENQAPSIELITPVQNQSYTQGQNVTIKANATDPENKIARVEFYANNMLIGVKSSAPYEFTVVQPPLGSYAVKSKVIDHAGLAAETSSVYVSVKSAWAARTNQIELISPSAGDKFKESGVIPVAVGGSEIQFDSLDVYVGGVKRGSVQGNSYDLKANVLASGANSIEVKMYQDGVELGSDSVQVEKLESVYQSNLLDKSKEPGYTFEIGPNPTADVLHIFLDKTYQNEDVEIQIYSIDGVTVGLIETNTSVGKVTIDVNGYSSGVYFIRIVGKVFAYEAKRFIKI